MFIHQASDDSKNRIQSQVSATVHTASIRDCRFLEAALVIMR